MSDEENIDENYASIISNWDLKEPEKKKKRDKRKKVEEDADYEMKPRTFGVENDNSLPIKLSTGAVVKKIKNENNVEKFKEEGTEIYVEEKQPRKVAKKATTNTKNATETKEGETSEKNVDTKKQIALLASSIVEDPNANVFKLKDIYEFTGLSKSTQNSSLLEKKLAILTLVTVYKDILPGYYIRELSQTERSQKVSKEVEILRKFEFSVLKNYSEFIKSMISSIENSRNSHRVEISSETKESKEIKPTIVKALCELLQLSHFNLHENILRCVVSLLNGEYGNAFCDALKSLFDNDENGKSSCRAVEYISDYVKAKVYNVKPRILEILLFLRLRKEFSRKREEPVASKKKNFVHMTKKDKKVRKEEKEIERDLKEAEAVVSKEEKDKWYQETLKYLFRIYFGILKNTVNSPLLPTVLEGLSKFSHLISVEFFSDLLNILRKLTVEVELATVSSLQCILTIFEIFSFQDELYLDLKYFYGYFYKIVLRLKTKKEFKLAERCFHKLFIVRREVPADRVAAFIHRLLIICGTVNGMEALRCLEIIKKLVGFYPKCKGLFEKSEKVGSGVFNGSVDDPDLVNPYATDLWMLSLLCNHYHPKVKQLARIKV